MQGFQRRSLFMGLVLAFLVPWSVAFAHSWGSHKASDRTASVTFSEKMELGNGTSLPAGTYRVEVPDNSPTPQVEFSQDGKVMATAQAKVVNQGNKNPYTEVDSVKHGDAQMITTIRPGGWHEILRFGRSNQAGSAGGGQ